MGAGPGCAATAVMREPTTECVTKCESGARVAFIGETTRGKVHLVSDGCRGVSDATGVLDTVATYKDYGVTRAATVGTGEAVIIDVLG